MRAVCRLLSSLLLFLCLHVRAQNGIFLSQGKIAFERKSREGSEAGLKSSYFDLVFTRNKTLYKAGRENPDNKTRSPQPAEDNVVYTDLKSRQSITQKRVFEQLFLVQDSTRTIKWKITDETRTIAGFTCRRANALIMDSIYVVAFYTDEILACGGPESFTGLPGMILGVALPHEHLSWFAADVQSVTVKDSEIVPPEKGKRINNAGLRQELLESLKEWGKQGRQYIQAAML